MNRKELNRRDFNRLSMAAFGGVVAGTMAGCGRQDKPAAPPAGPTGGTTPEDGSGTDVAAADGSPLLSEPHVCRGLNTCMNKGASSENACAGQGACATAKAHDCHTLNDCKGQGGCGESAGLNACKGKGECAVPLSEGTWKKARAAFEAAMSEAGKTFGGPPSADGAAPEEGGNESDSDTSSES